MIVVVSKGVETRSLLMTLSKQLLVCHGMSSLIAQLPLTIPCLPDWHAMPSSFRLVVVINDATTRISVYVCASLK